MPFSHHSHSGQFCLHAKDTLESMVLTAISKQMRSYALTEHMPRSNAADLYPEEIAAAQTPATLLATYQRYHQTALSFREKYSSRIPLLVGMEIDWIRPEESLREIIALLESHPVEFIVGSVHHVNTHPIDFDAATFSRALESCEGSPPSLFCAYFDAQYAMLTSLKPAVVGHFDLILLFSPTVALKSMPDVWSRVQRNARYVAEYGGLVELNSAAVRKGWKTPYPGEECARELVDAGARFTISDDAHGVQQVGQNYGPVLEYVKALGLERVHYLERAEEGQGELERCCVKSLSVEELEREPFWSSLG